MQLYLNKMKVIALLLMINEAEGMMSGSADGWCYLNKTDPDFYGDLEQAIDEMKSQLREKGYNFEKIVRPIIGY